MEQAARVIRAFRQSAALRVSLSEVAQEMDAYLANFFGAEEFVTVLLVDVTEPGCLRLVNAGHPDPYLVRAHDVHGVRDTPNGLPLGLGLGLFTDTYAEAVVSWQPGDRLLMYTDGLSEARDAGGEFFPLASTSAPLRSASVEDAVAGVVAAVNIHVPHARLDDDLAVVVIEHRAESAFLLPPTEGSREAKYAALEPVHLTFEDAPTGEPAGGPAHSALKFTHMPMCGQPGPECSNMCSILGRCGRTTGPDSAATSCRSTCG